MSNLELLSRSDILLISAATIVIVFAIVITAIVQGSPELPFAQVITAGPVWPTDAWLCTSTAAFIVHSTLIAYGDDGATIQIFVSGQGTQPDYKFEPRIMQSFSVGGAADTSVIIQKNTGGAVSGFITLNTESDAKASCEPLRR